MANANVNKNKEEENKVTQDDVKMNNIFQDVYKQISANTYDINKDNNSKQIEFLNDKINKVINSDLEEMRSYGGKNDLTKFLLNTIQSANKLSVTSLNDPKNDDLLESLFLSKDGSIFSTFEERFKNKALLFHDLEIISEQLVELNEAINTTRDDIIAADDLGSEIARSLSFSADAINTTKYDDLIEEVKDLEKSHKLPYIIREHIVPKTLKYGEYYVYLIPEQKLFENTQRKKLEKTNGAQMESAEINYLIENLNLPRSESKDYKPEDIYTYISENIKINNLDIPLPMLENTSLVGGMKDLKDFNSLNELLKKVDKKKDKDNRSSLGFSDGVKSFKMDDWGDTKGCYIKLLDPKKVIPIKIMHYTIGYYYIHDAEIEVNTNHTCIHGNRFGGNLMENIYNKSQNQRSVISSIADAIVKSFNKKYLEDNIEFKELIVNSLMYNDLYKKKLHYQFIPADHICRFSINEDENGNGQSMIYKSLFYAKLYLSLLVFNMITYLTKSQDTLVTYVKTSGIDKNVINKTMNIAKQMKAKQIGIGDLMDYSSIYGKIGTGRDIFIPEGESGERGLSWDVIQGQDVNMQSDLMEQLKEAFINGTGVPSVIMNYINEADFAKTLVMANAKQLRRVMMFQDTLNEQITSMYQKIMVYCSDIEVDDIREFEFKFQRPKTLPNNNLVDTIGYGDQILDFLEKSVFGEYGQGEDLDAQKDEFRNLMSRRILSIMPWETVDEVLKEVKLNMSKKKLEKATPSNDDMGGDDMSGGGDEY